VFMNLILLGAPGAGKGTQVEFLTKERGLPSISTGNILRAAIKEGTPIGLKAQEYISSGRLVPDEVIIGIVKERLSQKDCENGFILDGVPRTIGQAEALEKAGIEITAAILLDVPDNMIEQRMAGRRTCIGCGATYHVVTKPPKKENVCDECGGELTRRKDDDPETVRTRLKVYHEETEPLVDFYRERGKLFVVDGSRSPEETNAQVLEVLEKLK
jgi:adenylate kinase